LVGTQEGHLVCKSICYNSFLVCYNSLVAAHCLQARNTVTVEGILL